MKERWKGLAALWISLALLLSVSPIRVMAADDWESTRPKDKVYIYMGNVESGMELNPYEIPWGYLRFDVPFDEQEIWGDQPNFMAYVTIPDGYELKEWKVWSFVTSGSLGAVAGEATKVDKNGSLSEREYDNIRNQMDVLMNPVLVCKPPVVSITLGSSGNVWQTFSGGAAFQTFFKDVQSFAVSAEDVGSGIKSIQYYLSNTDLFPENRIYTTTEIEEKIPAWNVYTEVVTLSGDGKYILYVKAADYEENMTYASTGGIVIDGTAPVISVQNSGTIREGDTITFIVSDDYLDAVTVDGSAVTADNGVYTVTASKKTHKIVATDKAGNSVSKTVKVKIPEEENSNISSGGVFSLTAGKAYSLGAGNWMVAGDNTVYEGGITFYVGESGDYDFQLQ